MLKPLSMLKKKEKEKPINDDFEANPFDYNNMNDSQYCMPSNDMDVMINEEAEHPLGGQNFNEENLIDAPEFVQKNHIKFTQTAKKMDMKKLKITLWKSVISDEKLPFNKITEDDVMTELAKRHQFSDIYNSLKIRLNEKMRSDLSCPLAFVALLHLCNEKNLKLIGQPDLADFTIEQDKKL